MLAIYFMLIVNVKEKYMMTMNRKQEQVIGDVLLYSLNTVSVSVQYHLKVHSSKLKLYIMNPVQAL